ncbi:hypothetical protein LZ31DRAFT_243238 [Colletotrichum somersetense]|nr:hypothetical protein LZ31DRAFT_243238 [Colletotrichum somersetense]
MRSALAIDAESSRQGHVDLITPDSAFRPSTPHALLRSLHSWQQQRDQTHGRHASLSLFVFLSFWFSYYISFSLQSSLARSPIPLPQKGNWQHVFLYLLFGHHVVGGIGLG